VSLRKLLFLSSRTFALGIDRLPGDLGQAVMVAYLLLRVSDYLEDNTLMQPGEKARLLGVWDRVLAGQADCSELLGQLRWGAELSPDAEVARHAQAVIAGLEALPKAARVIVVRHVRDSTQGMARWAVRGPVFEDEADLDDYMHEVAGRVGYLLTELFAWKSPTIRLRQAALMPLSREFGLALQTVNVIRGLHDDFERGWVFVPRSFLREVGLEPQALFESRSRDKAMAVVDLLADKAQRHIRAAHAYVWGLPRHRHAMRTFCLLPLLFAERTLAVSRGNELVFYSEAKMTRQEVRQIVRHTTLFGWSNRWVDGYAALLAAG